MWEKLPVRYPPENWRAPPEAGYLAAQGMRRDSVDPCRPICALALLFAVLSAMMTAVCYRQGSAWTGNGYAAVSVNWVLQCMLSCKPFPLAGKRKDVQRKTLSTHSYLRVWPCTAVLSALVHRQLKFSKYIPDACFLLTCSLACDHHRYVQAGENDGSFFTRPMTEEELREQSEKVAAM